MSYKDDVDEDLCDNDDLSPGDRNGDYNLEEEDHACFDKNNDFVARATRSVYTIYCVTPSGRHEVRSEKKKPTEEGNLDINLDFQICEEANDLVCAT